MNKTSSTGDTPANDPALRIEHGHRNGGGGPRVRLDRRALLRGGAGATPVLLTLVSNPVSAANSCMVASSFVSRATFKSRNPTSTSISCGAKSLAEWRTYCVANAGVGTTTVASALGKDHPSITGQTLRYWIINSSATTGTDGLLRHLAAMYLTLQPGGLKAGWTAGNLTVTELRRIWSSCRGGGSYSPYGSGINWSRTQVIQWLEFQLNYTIPL